VKIPGIPHCALGMTERGLRSASLVSEKDRDSPQGTPQRMTELGLARGVIKSLRVDRSTERPGREKDVRAGEIRMAAMRAAIGIAEASEQIV
jgi:hypothetical protein